MRRLFDSKIIQQIPSYLKNDKPNRPQAVEMQIIPNMNFVNNQQHHFHHHHHHHQHYHEHHHQHNRDCQQCRRQLALDLLDRNNQVQGDDGPNPNERPVGPVSIKLQFCIGFLSEWYFLSHF